MAAVIVEEGALRLTEGVALIESMKDQGSLNTYRLTNVTRHREQAFNP